MVADGSFSSGSDLDAEDRFVQWVLTDLGNRADAYGAYSRSGKPYTAKAALTDELVRKHFRGEVTIGLHAIGVDQMCCWVCGDFDAHEDSDNERETAWISALAFYERLRELGANPLLEDSGGGYHVWVFFGEPLPAYRVRAWVLNFAPEGTEVFPKQDRIREGGFGNFVRLPGCHHNRGTWSRFWDGERWWDWPDGVELLLDREPCKADLVPDASEPPPREQHKKTGDMNIDDARKALECLWRLDRSFADDYDPWIKVGMILHSVDPSSEMLAAWDYWSRQSSKHEAGKCAEKWETFDGADGLGLGTLIKLASESTQRDSAECAENAGEESWEGPRPLVSATRAVPPFPLDALPTPLHDFAVALAEQVQVSPETAASYCLGAASVTICQRFQVSPWEGWEEETNIWVAVSAESGTRKSAVCRAALTPIHVVEAELDKKMNEEIARRNSHRRVLKRILDEAERDAAKSNSARDIEKAQRLAVEFDNLKALCPPRLVAANATSEGLAKLLADNDGRMLIASAEGAEVITIAAGLYTQGRDNYDLLLKSWTGDECKYDRTGADPITLPRPTVAMALMFQPSVLRDMASHPSFRSRGLIARFLFVIARSKVGYREAQGDPIPERVKQVYADMIGNLLRFVDERDEQDDLVPRVIRFGDAAAERLKEFFGRVEIAQREFGDLEGLRDWGSKAHGQAARLAAIIHMASHHDATAPWKIEVSAETASSAIRLAEYFLEHARAAFALMGEDPDRAAAEKLARYLVRKGNEKTTKRDIQSALPTLFPRVDLLQEPLRLLEEHGWVRIEQPEKKGPGRKPSPIVWVNPRLPEHIRHIRQNAPSASGGGDSAENAESAEGESSAKTGRVRF